MLANLISHTLIRPVGKIKIENFQVFDIHWLYRTSRYVTVKVDVTERNGVSKRNGIVITIWRTSAIEVTALSKTHFRNESYIRKRIYHGCEGQIEKSVSQASWCQTVTIGTDFSIYPSHPWLFVCVEVLPPSQPNGVMSSAVSLPNHTFTGQA